MFLHHNVFTESTQYFVCKFLCNFVLIPKYMKFINPLLPVMKNTGARDFYIHVIKLFNFLQAKKNYKTRAKLEFQNSGWIHECVFAVCFLRI